MKNLMIVLLTLLVISCGKEAKQVENTTTETKEKTKETVEEIVVSKLVTPAALKGYYVGKFEATDDSFYHKDGVYANKITISIDEVEMDDENKQGNVKGHSVVAGNDRPFEGKINYKEGTGYEIQGIEPGDDRYDGKFDFTIALDGQSLKGMWTANDKNLAVSERKYELERRTFIYNKNEDLPSRVGWATLTTDNVAFMEGFPDNEAVSEDVLRFNASNTKLGKTDIENMYKGDLEIIRNAIYARHGYSFKNRRMRFVFDNLVDWYMPITTDVRDDLTDLEKENIELLKRYEQHADKYYDDYGR